MVARVVPKGGESKFERNFSTLCPFDFAAIIFENRPETFRLPGAECRGTERCQLESFTSPGAVRVRFSRAARHDRTSLGGGRGRRDGNSGNVRAARTRTPVPARPHPVAVDTRRGGIRDSVPYDIFPSNPDVFIFNFDPAGRN